MTFLGLERPVEWAAQQTFNPAAASMVLSAQQNYANAVYNAYQDAKQDMKDFTKEYGDFMSPFAKDMERYGQIVGGIKNTINELYKRGIDPLRSPEGRLIISQLTSSVNPAEMQAMRANAKVGYAYLDAMQDLRRKGKYSQAQEDFDIAMTGGPSFSDFATSSGSGKFNMWDRSSPIEATTLTELSRNNYTGRTARILTKEDFLKDPRLKNYTWDPRYEWTGYLDSDLMKVAPGAAVSLASDPRAAYFRELSKAKALAANPNATAQDIQQQWYRDIADANQWALIDPSRQADQFALDNHRTANDIYAHSKNKALDHYYWTLEHGVGDDDKTHNIFRRAEKLANSAAKNTKQKGVVGEHTQYERSEQYYQWIDPVIQAGMYLAKDKDSGETVPIYTFSGRDLTQSGSIYHLGEDGKMYKSRIPKGGSEGDYTFVADGNMRALKIGSRDGKDYYKYWVSGKLTGPKGNVIEHTTGNGNVREDDNVTWIPVKERDYNYGQTQKKQ